MTLCLPLIRWVRCAPMPCLLPSIVSSYDCSVSYKSGIASVTLFITASFNCRRFLLHSSSHLKRTPFFIILYIGLVKSAYLGIHFLLNPKNPNKLCSVFLSFGAWSSVSALTLFLSILRPSSFITTPTNFTFFFKKLHFDGESFMLA